MNILESQVTDLNSLVEGPIALAAAGSMNGNGQRHTSSAESPAEGAGEGGKKKRRADDTSGNGSSQTRAKRNRYISIACNECKRRKIKCNGNSPCQRCGNLKLECQYAPNCCTNGFRDSEEFRQMNTQLATLQEQVDNLYANLNALRASGDAVSFVSPPEGSISISQPPIRPSPISPINKYRPSPPKHSSYRGPTSSAFNLDVAKNTLQNMGYQGLGVDEGMAQGATTPAASPPPIQPTPLPSILRDPGRDPLLTLDKDEMIRLCRVYEEEMGVMYPVVDIDQIIIHGRNIYQYVHAVARNGLAPPKGEGNPGINDERSLVLKMVLASATLTEGNGQSELGYRLFESVRGFADRLLHSETVEVKDLPLLVLVAIYHFLGDQEALAWRIIGQVARMSIELGLHRRESLFKIVPNAADRLNAVKLFWSIYVLDRRWSFGTGLPFALQDADIDPNLPEPEMDIQYLNVMIAYSRIGSKVWQSVCSFSPSNGPLNVEEIGYLDYQINRWQKNIPTELQIPAATSPPNPSRAIRRLQIVLYLRYHQMRILIYRPVLHSAVSIQENIAYATTVVNLARDTIRALTHLNQTSDIYRTQQVCYNYFLTSAIAVLFLASCHAPVHFSSLCREEFYMALDLVKGFSNKSWISKRLWKTIKGLKEIGPKLGLVSDVRSEEDPHSSAAIAMAGLAGHEISGMGNNYVQEGGGEVGSLNDAGSGGGNANNPSGFQMSHDMTSLFEAALGNVGANGGAGTVGNGNGGYMPIQDGDALGVGMGRNAFGGDEELYNQMKDLF